MRILLTWQMNIGSCAVNILPALHSHFQGELVLKERTESGRAVDRKWQPRQGLLALRHLAGAHTATSRLLDAQRLLLVFLGEPVKAAVVLHHSLDVLGARKVQFTLVDQCAAALASYHCECQVCSCASFTLTIQGGPFLLPGMCSVHVLHSCLHGHLQNCEHFRSLLN